jgi:hypothetical protein
MGVATHTGIIGSSEIALFTRLQSSVPAGHEPLTGLPCCGAVPTGLDTAVARAAVVIVGIGVVTGFARLTAPVSAADCGNARLPRCRALEIGLPPANPGTAVTTDSVAVIAILAQILLHQSVTTVGSGVHDRITLATVCSTGLPVGYRRVARLDAASVDGDYGPHRRTTGIVATSTRNGATAARAVRGNDT